MGESKNPRGAGSCYLGWVSSTEKERPSSSSATHSDESLRNLPGQEGKKTKQIHQHKLSDKKKSVTKKCGLKNKLNKIRVRHKPKEMDPCKQGKKTNLHQHKSQEHEYLVSKQIHAEHPGKFAKYIYIYNMQVSFRNNI